MTCREGDLRIRRESFRCNGKDMTTLRPCQPLIIPRCRRLQSFSPAARLAWMPLSVARKGSHNIQRRPCEAERIHQPPTEHCYLNTRLREGTCTFISHHAACAGLGHLEVEDGRQRRPTRLGHAHHQLGFCVSCSPESILRIIGKELGIRLRCARASKWGYSEADTVVSLHPSFAMCHRHRPKKRLEMGQILSATSWLLT